MSLSKARLLSHQPSTTKPDRSRRRIDDIRLQIQARGDLPNATVEMQLDLVDQLLDFQFGTFLLLNQGLDGRWTDYMIEYPNLADTAPANSLERDMLERFPLILATQERARHFNAQIQRHIRDGATFASIPCGLMRDLLGRDYDGVDSVRLVGIDLDRKSLEGAAKLARSLGSVENMCRFLQRDAWSLDLHQAFDLIASNGLNIYESSPDRQTALYVAFSKALKPGGRLITSFLTPPPGHAGHDWNHDAIDPQALELSRLVFADIIGAGFRCHVTQDQMVRQLREAGLETERVIFDRARMFPTIVARKP